MINENTGYQYIDAVLALVPLAKFYPSEDGKYENVEWVDERTQPTAKAVADKLTELNSVIDMAFNLTQKKRFYISDYGYSNIREVILGEQDKLIKGQNWDKFYFESMKM